MSDIAYLIRNLDLEAYVADSLQAEAPLTRCLRAAGEEEIAAELAQSFDPEATGEPLVLLLLLHEGAESLEVGAGSIPFLRHHGRLIPVLEGPISRATLLAFSDRLPFPHGTGALAGCTLRVSGQSQRLRVSLCGPPPALDDLDPTGALPAALRQVEAGLVVISGPAETRPELTVAAAAAALARERDLRIAVIDSPDGVSHMDTRSLLTSHVRAEAGSWEDTFDRLLSEGAHAISAGSFRRERLPDYLRAALSGVIVLLSASEQCLENLLKDLGWGGDHEEQRLLGYLLAEGLGLLALQERGSSAASLRFSLLANCSELADALRDLQVPPISRLVRAQETRGRAAGAPRSTGAHQRPTGTHQRPTGAQERPTGTQERPTGTHERPTGARQRPTGTHERPTGPRQRAEGGEA